MLRSHYIRLEGFRRLQFLHFVTPSEIKVDYFFNWLIWDYGNIDSINCKEVEALDDCTWVPNVTLTILLGYQENLCITHLTKLPGHGDSRSFFSTLRKSVTTTGQL